MDSMDRKQRQNKANQPYEHGKPERNYRGHTLSHTRHWEGMWFGTNMRRPKALDVPRPRNRRPQALVGQAGPWQLETTRVRMQLFAKTGCHVADPKCRLGARCKLARAVLNMEQASGANFSTRQAVQTGEQMLKLAQP